jgi:hypothetical protein
MDGFGITTCVPSNDTYGFGLAAILAMIRRLICCVRVILFIGTNITVWEMPNKWTSRENK